MLLDLRYKILNYSLFRNLKSNNKTEIYRFLIYCHIAMINMTSSILIDMFLIYRFIWTKRQKFTGPLHQITKI